MIWYFNKQEFIGKVTFHAIDEYSTKRAAHYTVYMYVNMALSPTYGQCSSGENLTLCFYEALTGAWAKLKVYLHNAKKLGIIQ